MPSKPFVRPLKSYQGIQKKSQGPSKHFIVTLRPCTTLLKPFPITSKFFFQRPVHGKKILGKTKTSFKRVHYGQNSISSFILFFSSIDKTLILGGNLDTKL